MPCYYSSLAGKMPEERISLDRFIENIYEEINSRLHTKGKVRTGKPIIRKAPYADKTFYELEWGSYVNLVRSLDEEKVRKALPFIEKAVEISRFREEVKNLTDKEENIQKRRENFEKMIKELIKSIELGNVLKGKCRHCP